MVFESFALIESPKVRRFPAWGELLSMSVPAASLDPAYVPKNVPRRNDDDAVASGERCSAAELSS